PASRSSTSWTRISSPSRRAVATSTRRPPPRPSRPWPTRASSHDDEAGAGTSRPPLLVSAPSARAVAMRHDRVRQVTRDEVARPPRHRHPVVTEALEVPAQEHAVDHLLPRHLDVRVEQDGEGVL